MGDKKKKRRNKQEARSLWQEGKLASCQMAGKKTRTKEKEEDEDGVSSESALKGRFEVR